jgi:hypothetical protein
MPGRFQPKRVGHLDVETDGQLFENTRRQCESAALHPSTEPEAIARRQRKAVREAIRAVGRDPVMISAEACLPVWVVERRLAEISLRKAAEPAVRSFAEVARVVAGAFAGGEPRFVSDIVAETNLSRQTVLHALRCGGYRKVEFVRLRGAGSPLKAYRWAPRAEAVA